MNQLIVRRNIFLVSLIMVCTLLNGCVYLVIGGLGALGGYIVSPDTVEGITGHDQADVWDVAYEVASIMGTIQESKESAGILNARINGAKVTITVLPMSSSAVKVIVKARKSFFPKISVAQDVYIKVMTRLNE